MNKIHRLKNATPYAVDYAQWCAEQGALLREGRFTDLDRENLAEEIESLGRSDRREIENRLKVLLVHLLKYKYQQEGRSGSWKATIREQRARIAKLLKESPSLGFYPAKVLPEEYSFAKPEAATETGLPEDAFPVECPFSISELLDLAFYPE